MDEIDVEAATKLGVDVVRRPTGGRAILHSEELTYSVVMPAEGKSVAAVYRSISEALVYGLRSLGIDATLEQTQPDFTALYRTSSSVACFTSSARHEIKVGGKKLVGSAQRRFHFAGKEMVLQHGSILLGPDHLHIVDLLAGISPADREALRAELQEKTVDVRSLLGTTIRFEDVATALRRGFEEQWNIRFSDQTLHTTQSVLHA
jgi:lipoate-protein ligase A